MKKIGSFLLCILLAVSLFPTVSFGAQPDGKLLAITFDDGPGPYTARLLDGLKERNAKATFFVLGSRVSGYRDIVARQYSEGHQVASHSWNHPQLTKLGGTQLAAQLNDTADAIRSVTGQETFYLRPPYGSYNATVKAYSGAPIILWSVDPLDWKYRNAETVKNNIVSHAKDGDIILVHDIHSTSVDGALAAIDILQAQGYEFVTVQELLRRRGITPEIGGVYSSAPNRGINLPAQTPVYDGEDFDESQIQTHWAYPSIRFVQENGIMAGIDENTFGPDKYLTKGMLTAVLSNLSGEDTAFFRADFSDVPADAWYAASIGWAEDRGIVRGDENGAFHPDEFVDRQTLYTMLERYAVYEGISFTKTQQHILFEDEEQISPWAREPIHRFYEAGLAVRRANNEFAPREKATRAMTAAVIHNFVISSQMHRDGGVASLSAKTGSGDASKTV